MDCANVFTALPASCLDGNGLLLPKGILLASSGHQFADASAAGTETNWKTDITEQELIHIPKIKEIEDLTTESTNWESGSGDIVFLYEGKVRMKFTFYLTVDQHKALRENRGKQGRLWIYDRAGNIMGTSLDGIIRQGFEVSFINVESYKIATPETPMLSVVEIQLENTAEFNETLVVIQPYKGTVSTRWSPYTLPQLTDSLLEQVGNIAATVVTFDVSVVSTSVTDNDGDPVAIGAVTGLDIVTYTNFQFTVGGTITAPSSMTYEGKFGDKARYTATVTAIAATDTMKILPTVDNANQTEPLTLT